MMYVFSTLWPFVVIATLLGVFTGWWMWGHYSEEIRESLRANREE